MIAAGFANNGAGFFFLVESGLPASAFYYIQVASEADPGVFARSDCFTISSGDLSRDIKVREPFNAGFNAVFNAV